MWRSTLVPLLVASVFLGATAAAAVEVELLPAAKLERHAGSPDRYTLSFSSLFESGIFYLDNGDGDGTGRVSSARIWLNGQPLFGPNDFHQRVGSLEADVALNRGENLVEVELRSAPGSHLSVRCVTEIAAAGAAQVGPAGGSVRVDDETHPLFGIELEIPPGAVGDLALFTIGAAAEAGQPLPGGAVQEGPAFDLESTSPLLSPIFGHIPFWGDQPDDEARVVFYFNPDSRQWETVGPFPGPDPEKAKVLLPHLSTYARGRVVIPAVALTTSFDFERDVHRNRNDRAGCRCDSGQREDNGLCAGMTLLAQEYFERFTSPEDAGLYCRWGEATDFTASCEAHCRFNGEQEGWVDDFAGLLSVPLQVLGALNQGFTVDYVKFRLALGLPTSLGLLGAANDGFAGHAVLAIGWRATGLFSGEFEIYDPNDNRGPATITYVRAGLRGRASLAYAGDWFTYEWSMPITPFGLGLDDVIRSYPDEDVCNAVTCNPTTVGNGTVKILGGALAGQSLSEEQWTIYVSPGESLTGTVQVETHNFMGSNAVAPFGYTWTWGDRVTAIRTISGWISTGRRSWNIPINLTAPATPGTFYLLFGFNGEFNMQQVLSCDNWAVPGIVWNDGNDYHDLDAPRLECAHEYGYAPDWKYRISSGYRDWEVPVAPIRIVVEP